MPRTRTRLINAARRSMIQRAELQRKLGIAGDAFKPRALYNRGKYRLGAKVDDTAAAVQKQFRDNRLPIAIAAVAGLAWIFREPIKDHVPKLAQKVQELADAARAKFQPRAAEDDLTEDQDEATE